MKTVVMIIKVLFNLAFILMVWQQSERKIISEPVAVDLIFLWLLVLMIHARREV